MGEGGEMGCPLVVRSVFGLVQTCVADDERSWPQTFYVGSTCRPNPSCPIQCRSPLLSVTAPLFWVSVVLVVTKPLL